MLTVTEKAAAYLREALTRKKEDAPEAIRIVYTEEGYQLTLDDPKEGDQIFEQEGQNYLLVDTALHEALDDAIIDVQESPQGFSLSLLAASSPAPATEGSEDGSEPRAEPASEPAPEASPEADPQPET